jgi:hypothetical protein
MEPTFKCGTSKAINELAEELNLPNTMTMQDWSYEVANPNDLDKYITHYGVTTNDDKKFVLMEIIIRATAEQKTEKLFRQYWGAIKPILATDFKLHEFTIRYWACFDNEDQDQCWEIATLMRQLFKEKYKHTL